MKDYLHISSLIKKEITGEINASEKAELEMWANQSAENRRLKGKISDRNYQLEKLKSYRTAAGTETRKKIESEIFTTKTIFLTSPLLKVAAVLVPVLIGGLLWMILRNQTDSQAGLAQIDEQIYPGTYKAVLTLSSGDDVQLEESDDAKLIEEKGFQINQQNDQLNYSDEGIQTTETREEIFNTLTTPKGGQYRVRLSDGTQVWLNAASSISYPVAFTDSVRKVILTGEAFFDVAHNGIPFIVETSQTLTRVLGTKFNITAYNQENNVKTTLVEGKVAVKLTGEIKGNKNEVILEPGQQAISGISEENLEVKEVNTSHYTSWIEGKLEFNNQDLEYVVQRLSRWYNFDYKFENQQAKDFHFSARFQNTDSISKIFNMLELTTDITFKTEDDVIIIK